MTAAMRVRFLRWRELRQLRKDRDAAYWRWRRASDEYADTAVIFGRDSGAWSSAGPAGRAQDAVMDRVGEYQALDARVRRLEGA